MTLREELEELAVWLDERAFVGISERVRALAACAEPEQEVKPASGELKAPASLQRIAEVMETHAEALAERDGLSTETDLLHRWIGAIRAHRCVTPPSVGALPDVLAQARKALAPFAKALEAPGITLIYRREDVQNAAAACQAIEAYALSAPLDSYAPAPAAGTEGPLHCDLCGEATDAGGYVCAKCGASIEMVAEVCEEMRRKVAKCYLADPHEIQLWLSRLESGGRCCSSSHEPPDTACRSFLRGSNGRCVYCDHEEKCHPGPGATCEIGSGEGGGQVGGSALEAVFAEVAQWARETFPRQSAQSIAEHLRREAAELAANPTDAEELADVLMLAADLADKLGVNAAEIMERKLAACRARDWKPDSQGVYEHIRADAPVERAGAVAEGACAVDRARLAEDAAHTIEGAWLQYCAEHGLACGPLPEKLADFWGYLGVRVASLPFFRVRPAPEGEVKPRWCRCGHLLMDHSIEGRCTAGSDHGGCLCAEPDPWPDDPPAAASSPEPCECGHPYERHTEWGRCLDCCAAPPEPEGGQREWRDPERVEAREERVADALGQLVYFIGGLSTGRAPYFWRRLYAGLALPHSLSASATESSYDWTAAAVGAVGIADELLAALAPSPGEPEKEKA